jgi:hypothetical protein
VPFGICTNPTNVKAHGQACPFRHQCSVHLATRLSGSDVVGMSRAAEGVTFGGTSVAVHASLTAARIDQLRGWVRRG